MSNKNKNILLGLLIVGIISMTVAFAALSTNLRISGSANVAATRWNIHFQEWNKVSIPTVNGHQNTAVSPEVASLSMSDNTNVTKVDNVNVTLNQPGDIAKYTFEIINEGTIDAKLDNFTVTDTTSNDLVDYNVKCYESSSREGTEVTTNSVLGANGGVVYCYLQVQYKDKTNSHTAGTNQVYSNPTAITTNLSASWRWVQADGSSAQSGGTEPDPEPVATWDSFKTITNNEWESTLPDGSTYWVQKNSTTGVGQACGILNGTQVCLNTSDATERQNELNTKSGYVLEMKTLMESIIGNNYECKIGSYTLECSDGVLYARLRNNGNAEFATVSTSSKLCYISPTGSANCW